MSVGAVRYVGQKGNNAIVYASPGATATAFHQRANVGESVTTNSKGKATVGFDLPEGLTVPSLRETV